MSDVDAMFDYWRDERFWRYLRTEAPTETSLRELIARVVADQSNTPRLNYFLGVIEAATGRLIGEACLDIDPENHRAAGIGWAVHHDHTGKGIGTEIARLLVAFGSDTLRLNQFVARCHDRNPASRRIMAKLGMVERSISRDPNGSRGEGWSTVHATLRSCPVGPA